MTNNRRMVQIIVGLGIILLGVIILIDLFARFVDIEVLLRWWPIVFILIGFLQISSQYSHAIWTGVALLLTGTIAVLDRMDLLGSEFRPIVIITVLLLVGLLLVTPAVTIKTNH